MMSSIFSDMKFSENGIKVWTWHNEKLYVRFWHGAELVIDPALYSMSLRTKMFKHGIESRHGDKAAIEIKKIPDRTERSKEAYRLMKELHEYYCSGTDAWDMPRGPRETGPNEADLTECLDRVYPGKGQSILTASLTKLQGDLKAVREKWLGTEQVNKAWRDLQAERRAAAAKGLPSSDDVLAEFMAE
jgi:hypothetical protein